MSVTGDGTSTTPFRLVNDEDDPGFLYVYGTNSNGVKGWYPLYSTPGSSGSESGSESESASDSESYLIEDIYVTSISFNTETRILTLTRSEGMVDLTIEIPGGTAYTNYDWTVLTAKDITAGTAQDYVILMKARESFTIDSLVYECDTGTLTGCSVKIDGVAVTGLSSLSVSSSETETNATGNNTVSVGDRITFHTSVNYTGAPTLINIQLNFTR